MTIDERLEALLERHEALTQTVELIAHAQIKNDAEIDKLTVLMAETGRFINQLAHIAQAHGQRIEDLENR